MTRSVYLLPLTRRALCTVEQLSRRGPLRIIGSPDAVAAMAPGLAGHAFMTPLNAVRALAAGSAPDTLVSFPELLGGRGPSSIELPFCGGSYRFSTVELRLVLGGYRAMCARHRRWRRSYAFADVTAAVRAADDEQAMMRCLLQPLGVQLAARPPDHLHPGLLQRKTRAGFALGTKDQLRDLHTVIRLLCARVPGLHQPEALVRLIQNHATAEVK